MREYFDIVLFHSFSWNVLQELIQVPLAGAAMQQRFHSTSTQWLDLVDDFVSIIICTAACHVSRPNNCVTSSDMSVYA